MYNIYISELQFRRTEVDHLLVGLAFDSFVANFEIVLS